MYRKIKLSILSAFLIFLFADPSSAQQTSTETKISPEKQALIKEYFEATGGRKSVNDMLEATYTSIDNTLPMLMSAMIEQNTDLTSSQKADLQKKLPAMVARLSKRFRDELNKELDFAKVVEDVNYPLLNKYFTESELKDLIVFYRSSTGQKVVAVQPKLYTETTTRLNAVLIPAVQKVMQRMTVAEIAEIVEKSKQGK